MPHISAKKKLCTLGDIDAEKGLILPISEREDILLLMHTGKPIAFLNRCPHARAKLNMNSERVIAIDGFHLFCSVHGAHFHPITGRCVLGPCHGQYLTPLEVASDGENVWWNGQIPE